MAEPTPQRAWRALCSSCGAPVEFRSAASPMAVCSYCRSTLLREGETLRRIGHSAALFEDHSPLTLGVSGKLRGEHFTLIGRLQMSADDGRWNEWHALFDDGRSAWLSEDNGGYVFAMPQPAAVDPESTSVRWASLRAGEAVVADGQGWSVGSVVSAQIQAAQGELAFVPDLKNRFQVIELRNAQGQVLSVDTSESPPRRYLGHAVRLADLALSGLREGAATADLTGRALSCPNCGAALVPRLGDTRSISCPACSAVVDISQGAGADLAHYQQQNGLEPLIPLGTTGMLDIDGTSAVQPWQVVGYLERCDQPSDPEQEQTFWREYLLYNTSRGFAFLVDADEGWSVVSVVTGAPSRVSEKVNFGGATYRKQESYTARTTHVLGEFYWTVRRDQRSLNTDYQGVGDHKHRRLNREQTGQEITWSAGRVLNAAVVMKAFGIKDDHSARFKRDVGSSFEWSESSMTTKVLVVALMLLLLMMVVRCSEDCDQVRESYGSSSYEYQQCRSSSGSGHGGGSHGGSWGGYSSGGFHK